MIKTSMDVIRAAYPNPVNETTSDQEYDYCVGGAFCLYMIDNDRRFATGLTGPGLKHFPSPTLLTDALMLATGMSLNYAENYAWNIIQCNDYGEFDEAWAWLDKALTHRGNGE